MGSFENVEICELGGLFLLSQLLHININAGLYRDDGLDRTKQTPGNVENVKKEIYKIFKTKRLNITAEANKKVVDFLNVTLDLHSGLHQAYNKSNSTINYIHRDV